MKGPAELVERLFDDVGSFHLIHPHKVARHRIALG
jgi:hypothetical protein